MTRQGRSPSQQPALAYDYRRAILLCQVLAEYTDVPNRQRALYDLAVKWGIDSEGSLLTLLTHLAQHALEHGREQAK